MPRGSVAALPRYGLRALGALRSQALKAEALLAVDFLEAITLTGARLYVLAVIDCRAAPRQRGLLDELVRRRSANVISIA
ncbi:hypothetical protein ACIA5C_37080 [Actinoplanes sp. NPDC051343]|uniref:hypothetical protein n=1 Tax=Actinoplanes sp. NPDC051343 TaxID=3363906 RepID=UPI0037A95CAE